MKFESYSKQRREDRSKTPNVCSVCGFRTVKISGLFQHMRSKKCVKLASTSRNSLKALMTPQKTIGVKSDNTISPIKFTLQKTPRKYKKSANNAVNGIDRLVEDTH